jgi:hypothetical protein
MGSFKLEGGEKKRLEIAGRLVLLFMDGPGLQITTALWEAPNICKSSVIFWLITRCQLLSCEIGLRSASIQYLECEYSLGPSSCSPVATTGLLYSL